MLLDQVKKSKYKQDKGAEKPLRSMFKAISWRVVGTLDTIGISWILTGEIKTALAIGSVELVTKMLLYFGHERIWDRINYGRQ
nr:DUF2061 domain-containing protein [Gillisia sp. Hel_I_86]